MTFNNRFYKTVGYPKYQMFLLGCLELLESLIRIFSLGTYGASYSFFYMSYIASKKLEKEIIKKNNVSKPNE